MSRQFLELAAANLITQGKLGSHGNPQIIFPLPLPFCLLFDNVVVVLHVRS